MPESDIVRDYFQRYAQISGGAATGETSFYSTLEDLLNQAGGTLRPVVVCNAQLRNQGAGHPDFGLYTARQLTGRDLRADQIPNPERGVVEVKGLDESLHDLARSEQTRRYASHYGLVLVTNYREFMLVSRHGDTIRTLERLSLAKDATSFRDLARRHRTTADQHGKQLVEYLKRALTQTADITEPRQLATLMASYARDALDRVERARQTPQMNAIRGDLEQALGIAFGGEEGAHFFHSTLVQTLFYGIFSAWVLHAQSEPHQRFDWRTAAYYLHVPIIVTLFERLSTATTVRGLNLQEVLDWTGDALNRVDRETFFARFERDDAVQYFYEPFLESFDPVLRRSLGVWYTPKEIVRYQVARVDRELKERLNVPAGLADDSVHILDPCCGTGAYLREVMRTIAETYQAQGLGALVGHKLKEAAANRIHGFEIMPAPFVVAHLQIGLFLQGYQAPFEDDERAGVYLTNALTGWIPDEDRQIVFSTMPELAEERDQAVEVKRDTPILVILGNPPYSGYAGIARMAEERDLVRPYRQVQRVRPPEGQGLNDLYVRFFRMAERRIAETTGRGVISFISNYSWLDGLSFTGMRERYLSTFDVIRIDNMHGDRYATGKRTPDGLPCPSVFSTEYNREGIQVGTAIATLTRRGPRGVLEPALVHYRDFFGITKRADVLAAVEESDTAWTKLAPDVAMGLRLRPGDATANYFSWPKLTDLMPSYFPGVKTSRDEFLVSIEREPLEVRIREYFNPSISDQEIAERYPSVMSPSSGFDPIDTRRKLQARGPRIENIVRYAYRPFDVRWLYWDADTRLLDRSRPEYWPQITDDNTSIQIPLRHRRMWGLAQISALLSDLNILDGGNAVFPLFIREVSASSLDIRARRLNLSRSVVSLLTRLDCDPKNFINHLVAVLFAPAYQIANNDALRADWPRIPVPNKSSDFASSVELGQRLIGLLDPEIAPTGHALDSIAVDLPKIGSVIRRGTDSSSGLDLVLSAGWGHGGNGRAVMPARGSLTERPYSTEERRQLSHAAEERGFDIDTALSLLGRTCFDVDLNQDVFWSCVPSKVWSFQLGGYQVIKKWLSYREHAVLGRALRHDEVLHVTHMARRIAAILLLGPELDANYHRVAADTVDLTVETSRQGSLL